ncbi:MAG TPA: hypothetical protein VM432_04445, partial [Bdellovibrionales bacterium]|nr:hypothetical protein [Bdellovibrionales bacterium]
MKVGRKVFSNSNSNQILKRVRFIGLAILTVVSSAGCGIATQDSPDTNRPMHVGSADTKCLAKALDTVADYFKSKSNAKEVDKAWSCFGNAINSFLTQTQGQDANSYKATEIRAFFEIYFLGDLKITDEMLAEVMRVKQ